MSDPLTESPTGPQTDGPADLDTSYRALRDGAGWWWRDRDVVLVGGPDSATYLQGQLSQDITAVPVGSSVATLLLHPDGKVVAWLRLTRLAADRFALDVDAGFGDAVIARLKRFMLRVKVDLTEVGGSAMRCLSLRGPTSDAVEIEMVEGAIVAAPLPNDLPGRDVFVIDEADARIDGTAVAIDPEAYEVVRIEQGLPAMGAELTEKTIPGEAGAWLIQASVSFTKGCYTGQELVARIDSRGNNVPRHLRAIVLGDPSVGVPPVGAEVVVGDKVVGALTSVAWSPGQQTAVALAYVGRAVDPPAEAMVRWPMIEAPVAIRTLPLT